MAPMNKKKLHTCKLKTCRKKYKKRSAFQVACSPDCAYNLVKIAKAKKAKVAAIQERIKIKQRIAELKPIQYWLKRAEKAFNAWIRERDKDQPCISCGTVDSPEFHAGHFIPATAHATRFDPACVHKQCAKCNVFLGGNQTNYEIRLVARIGQAEVDRLKNAKRERKWTRDELQTIEAQYKSKFKALTSA